MELDGKQIMMLREGLKRAFFTYEEFRRFLKETCDFELNQVAHPSDGLLTVFDKAIYAALGSGWIDRLLEACAAHTNPGLKSVATMLQGQLAKSRPLFYAALKVNPFAALFLGKEQCFIGRKILRAELSDMHIDQEERRVLIVNAGEHTGGLKTGCGKTYSYGLLRLLDRLGNGNIVVKIDFREFREGDLGSRYRDIVEKINARMRVPSDEIPKMNESQTRWFQNAIDKFEVVARERHCKLWLVFDHMGSGEIEDKIADALASTAIYTISEASALHVVLIDVDPTRLKLETPMRQKLRSDKAQLPAREELVNFLKDARTMSGKTAVSDADIDNAATQILSQLGAFEESQRAYQYSQLTWKSSVQLGFVQ